MALYEKLSATSSPEDIAAAYKEFTGLAGGDTAAVQKQAVDYLTALGIGAPAITQAYDIYQKPAAAAPTSGLSTAVDNSSANTASNVVSAGALAQAANTGNLQSTVGSTVGSSNLANTGSTGALTQASTQASTGADTSESGLSTLNNTAATKVVNPFDAVTAAWNSGDYAATNDIIATSGLTADDIKNYYKLDDATMNWVLSQGIKTADTTSSTSGLSTLNNTATTGTSVSTGTSTGLDTGSDTGSTGALTQATQSNEVYIGDNRWLNTITGQITTDWNRAAPAKTITKEEDRDGMHFRYYSDGSMDSSVQSTDSFLDFIGDVAPDLAVQIGLVMAGGPAGAELSSALGSTVSSQLGLNLSAKAAQALGAGLIRGTLTSAAGGDFVTGAITGAASTGANLPIGDTGLTLGNIGTAVKLLNANDAASVFSALASDPTLSKQTSGFLGTEATNAVNTGLKINNIVTRLQNGQNGAALTLLGELANSSDTKLAGAALSAYQAIQNGASSAQISSALLNLSNSAGSSSKSTTSTTGSTTVSDSVPLTEEEISFLSPEQLKAYQDGGVSGLREFNRAAKLAATTDSTSTTRGLTGTTSTNIGALSTATTEDEFDNLMITSLRSQGLNNAQISAYLDNLNSASSGLNDIGLLAFRQAKISGATDAEALAAANLATGKTTTQAETETETGTELIVTDQIVSELESLPDFGSEMIVTSGRETPKETEFESETETASEIIVTEKKDTKTTRSLTTDLETESEIIVTNKRETESEFESEVVVTEKRETESEFESEIVVTQKRETESEFESEIVVTEKRETESEFETETQTESEIVVTEKRETETKTETETEIIITSKRETESETETETETETEIIVTEKRETESETETETEIIITSKRETESQTDTETEIIVTASRMETETETFQPPVVTGVVTKPATTTSAFSAGPAALGGSGKPIDFLKENLLKTYMTKQSFKDPLAEFTKARTDMMKENMMQQGVDPRLAAILAAKMNGTEPPPAPAYNYGEEPSSIDDILSLKGEGDQYFAQGGYVQPLMAQGGMALPLLAAKGGLPTTVKGREDFRDGKHVAGEGDGQSDDIPAMLADGEFVFPADVVSALGNGSTKAGTDKLYEMMHSIRDRARSKGPKDLPPPAFKSPLDYLKKR